MKRIYRFVALFTSLFLVLSLNSYAYNPTTDIEYDSTLKPFYFEKGGNLKGLAGDMLTYAIRSVQPEIWDLFWQEGVRVYATQSVPNYVRTDGDSFYDGLCYSATFTYAASGKVTKVSAPVAIYIYGDAFRADSYQHECGHALDYIAEYITGKYQGPMPISNSSEWKEIYSRNAAIMATFDGSSAVNVNRNCNEGFAEAYRLYSSYPQKLQTNCPEVYNFVASQISKYAAYVPALNYNNFDYWGYANDYPDLMAAYGYDKKALWDHYMSCGKNEGRQAKRVITPKR